MIEDNIEEIRRLCELYGVRQLEVFGSILREDFDPQRSDVDVLVEFEPQAAENFLDLKEALEGLLGRRVDLVELRAVRNRRLRRHIEQSKYPVYFRPVSSEVLGLCMTRQEASDHL